MDDDPLEFRFEGSWTHWLCPQCEEIIEIEDDLQNGCDITCDACGYESITSR